MEVASKIDHTILSPESEPAKVQAVVAEAIAHRFASVCVSPMYVKKVAEALRGSGVKTCSVVGFPHGTSRATVKAIEATAAIKDGADEVDFVAFLPTLIAKDVAGAKAEYLEIVRAARSVRKDVVIKVIVESAALMKGVDAAEGEARIEAACQAVRESGCDFIKTSTGYHPAGGATLEAVQAMKKHGQGLYVKASGGIRTYEDAVKYLEAGADRLGCSASVAIAAGAGSGGGAAAGGY